MLHAAVFLDKDGTLVDDVPYNVDPALVRFSPGTPEALGLLASMSYDLFVVSNQSGVALGYFELDALSYLESHLKQMFSRCGATLRGAYWCPHHPQGTVEPFGRECACRKPLPGMVLQAAREHQIDLSRSWFIGDILNDVEAGNRAGCRTILLDNGHESEWLDGPWRTPTVRAPDLLAAAQIIVAADEAFPPRMHAHVDTFDLEQNATR